MSRITEYITILMLLNVAISTSNSRAQEPSQQDEERFESILKAGTPAKGFMKSVTTEISKCKVRVEIEYDRQCGTAFDEISILSSVEEINLANFRHPLFVSGETTNGIMWMAEKLDDSEEYNSVTRTISCSGKQSERLTPGFSIESGDLSNAQEDFEFMVSYQNKFCR